MIELVEEPWPVLKQLCTEHGARQLDILTGFIGQGATRALAALGVRARIVIGLGSERAALSAVQVEEIRALLAAEHEIRWLAGLHAKLYLVGRRAVLVGSANFTRSGFERLDELGIVTDEPSVVARAAELFEQRFRQALPVEPDGLTIASAPAGDTDVVELGLGTRWNDRASGFTRVDRAVSPAIRTASELRPDDDESSDDATIAIPSGVDGFMYSNVTEGPHRCWADCRRYGFLAAGQDRKWSDQLHRLKVGTPVYAYMQGRGYVGLGVVDGTPCMASDHVVAGRNQRLFDLPLVQPGIKTNAGNPDRCEWVVPVRWLRTLAAPDAVAHGRGYFSSQHVACRLTHLPTLEYLSRVFQQGAR